MDFDKVSQKLMNETILYVNSKPYRIVELEYYLYNSQHPDIFCHNNEMQLKKSHWYFHRTGKFINSNYKAGTYKGLDITFGNDLDSYGGILIRSLQSLETDEVIEGPCKCVNLILKLCNVTNIKELVSNIDLNVYKKDLLYISKNESIQHKSFVKGPRIGLTFKGKDIKVASQYIFKPYRYLISNLCKKEKWGICLTQPCPDIRNSKKYEIYYNKGKIISEEEIQKHLPMKSIESKCICFGYFTTKE